MQIPAHLCSENLSLPKISEESLLAEVHSPTSAATEITAPALAPTFLPLAWILDPDKHRSITDRILAQLALAEAKESCADEKQNYRQAFICVSLAAKDSPLPFVESSYACYGLHPDKLWPAIVARRKADLGKDYSNWYDENDLAIAGENPHHSLPGLSPKVQSGENAHGKQPEASPEFTSSERSSAQSGPEGLYEASVVGQSENEQCSANEHTLSGKSHARKFLVPSQPIKKPSQSVGRNVDEEVA